VVFAAGVGGVGEDDEDVGLFQFLQRGPEGVTQFLGEVLDKAHRVRDDSFRVPGKTETGALWVQRREEVVFSMDVTLRQCIKQGRFTRVRIPYDGYDGESPFSSPAAARLTMFPERVQFTLETADPVADAAAIDFQLRFTGTAAADAAGEAGHGRVFRDESGQEILELSKLHLQFSRPGMGPLCEDIQNELGAVDDLQVRLIGDGPDLGRRQFMIENEEVGSLLKRLDHEGRKFAPAGDVPGVQAISPLQDRIKDGDARCPGKLDKFSQGFLSLLVGVSFHVNEESAVRGGNGACPLPSCVFRFQGLDKGGEIDINGGRRHVGDRRPVGSVGIFR